MDQNFPDKIILTNQASLIHKEITMEIERKYLIDTLPDHLEQYACKQIEQGYLNTDPVVRIRKSNDKYTLTYKGAGLMCREEYNLPLNAEAFAHLKEKIDGILIEKKRYLIPLTEKLTIELDVFEGELPPSWIPSARCIRVSLFCYSVHFQGEIFLNEV